MMKNMPFLSQVARHYLDAECLEDYCFVFPNRRSGQFFTHYLQQQLINDDGLSVRPHLMTRVTSITELVAELTGTVAATDIELMFALYDAYCGVMGDAAQEFDKFIYWAHLIIGDFNDIDRSLTSADDIYQNLSDLHGLSSNYLSPEVQEKVKQLFGVGLFTAFFDTTADATLWQERKERQERQPSALSTEDEDAGDDRVKREFMSLWNALASIYHRYHDELDKRGLVSPGRQLRLSAEGAVKPLRYRRLVLVGFGVLSAAEVKLFERFKQDGMADFWWDNAGVKALLDKARHDPGALLIDGYCKRFGAQEIEPLSVDDPSMRVVAVPSNVGQAKLAFDELCLMREGSGQTSFGIDTAIVLPDEGLLVPLLHSVHGVDKLNVTLGYPLRSSGIVSLMHIVARMHNQATMEAECTYYREDVYDILSHPLIKTYFAQESVALATRLMTTNRFRIPASELQILSFGSLFIPAKDSLQSEYIDNLLTFCELLMGKMIPAEQESDDGAETGDHGVELPLQQAFLVMYIDVLNQLKRSLSQCGQTLRLGSVFYLIDRLAAAAIVPFTGEPLQGVQIMGLLETRNLDFKNVVILSMNERVFPRRRSINSFIPNYIRRAHGMSTIEQQEAIVAFNFYRLLNRASHVTLIYDSSAQATSSSEPSRYIAQLEKIYGKQLRHVEYNPVIQTSSPINIAVPNSGTLRDVYTRSPQDGGKSLSASAINKYVGCPLLFYFHYVQGLNDDNEVSDFMDYGTFGTIVHDTLGDCYDCEALHARGHIVDAEYIDWYCKHRLDKEIVRNIKRTYLHVPEDELDASDKQLKGEARMLVDTIKSYVFFVLNHDKKLIEETGGPFKVLECEQTHVLPAMTIGAESFNFTYKPDRIDQLADSTVRIVDYKTGGDLTVFSDMVDLFGPQEPQQRRPAKLCKAILQLFLYCYAYLQEHDVKKVMPVIYKLASMDESGVELKGQGQYVFKMDDTIAQEFIQRMGEMVKRLYDNEFTQAEEGSGMCDYCRFIDFCRRVPRKRD